MIPENRHPLPILQRECHQIPNRAHFQRPVTPKTVSFGLRKRLEPIFQKLPMLADAEFYMLRLMPDFSKMRVHPLDHRVSAMA